MWAALTLGLWNVQVLADFLRKEIDDLAMAWNRRRFLPAAIDVNGVVAAFAQKLTAVAFRIQSDHAASSGRKRFAQDVGTTQRLFCQLAIRLQNHFDRFLQVCARFL
jgi:hypothetical protein